MVSYKSVATFKKLQEISLNPYCSGRWSRTTKQLDDQLKELSVLILIVVEDGLVPITNIITAYPDKS